MAIEDDAAKAGDKPVGDTLLTKADQAVGDGKPADGQNEPGNEPVKEPAKEPTKEPADQVPDKPEGYALKFAEGTQVDAELLTDFQKAAHKMGISQAKAQELATMYQTHAAKTGERMVAAQRQAIEAMKTQWEDEARKSPTFEKDVELARSALRQFGDEGLTKYLSESLAGSHPAMVAFMARIGKALAEPEFRGQNVGGKEKTAADILYPNQGK